MIRTPRIVNKHTPAALCSHRIDGVPPVIAVALPSGLTTLLLRELDAGTLDIDLDWSANIESKNYLIAPVDEQAFKALAIESGVSSATCDNWIASARSDDGELTVLFEPAYLTQPAPTGLAVWHRQERYWLVPDTVAVNGNGQLLINHVAQPYDGPSYAVHRDTGLTADGGQRLLEGHVVQWGHRAGFEESQPRKAVVVFHPIYGVGFNTVNLGAYDQFFGMANFAYAEVLNEAMTILGHVRDKNADYPNEHAAFRYFDVPPED